MTEEMKLIEEHRGGPDAPVKDLPVGAIFCFPGKWIPRRKCKTGVRQTWSGKWESFAKNPSLAGKIATPLK